MNLTDHNRQNKIAVINDFSGFGRCSIAVALPIISHMKIQACPLPTSIFSNHTGFSNFFFDDYTSKMTEYIDNWKKIGLKFNGILTGFLGSDRQIDIVSDFIKDFRNDNTIVVIDPVMGDNGRPYSTYTPLMCEKMKELACHGDILTPNLTEACILTDTEYMPDTFKIDRLFDIAVELGRLGPDKIVITGISTSDSIGNVIYEKGHEPVMFYQTRVGHERSGTGDIFSAIIAADSVHKINFADSVKKASEFIRDCILVTEQFDIPPTDGVCFEEILHTLKY